MIDGLNLPDPGEGRYWEGAHQPHKKNTPLRIELRERTNRHRSERYVKSWTKLIAYDDTIADVEAVRESANKILDRAAKVDQFVGILTEMEGAE